MKLSINNSYQPSATRNEQVSLEAQMGSIAEVSAVQNNFTRYAQTLIKHRISKAKKKNAHTRQFYILILNFHKITILAQFSSVEMLDSKTTFGESDQLLTVNTDRVRKDATSIDDSDRFVRRQ